MIKEVRPDRILVHGDIATTLVGSLAVFYDQVAVGHVQAGLRTYNKQTFYPEEMNRHLSGIDVDLHFAPNETAAEALLKENKLEDRILITGNTVMDALKDQSV